MADFDAAVHFIAHYVPEDGSRFSLGNDVKLRFYGLYKQATEGSCSRPRPGVFDVIGCKKYDAWASNGNRSTAEAKGEYVQELTKLKADWREWQGVSHLLVVKSDTDTLKSDISVTATHTPDRLKSAGLREKIGVAQDIQDSLLAVSDNLHDEVRSACLPPEGPLVTVEPMGTPSPGEASDRGIYEDFTHSTASQRGTPSTFNIITNILTPAAATAYRLLGLNYGSSPPQPPIGTARSVISAVRTSASTATTPAVPHSIRWSYSPNQAVSHSMTPTGLLSSDDPVAEAHAIEHTAASLAVKLDHAQLSHMCAELQLQVAKQQLLLRSAQESLEFYVGTLQGMDSSNAWTSTTQLGRKLEEDPLTRWLVFLHRSAINFYLHVRHHTSRYVILTVVLIFAVVIRKRRIARR